MKIGFVTVLVADCGNSLDFYTDTLGMEISARDSNPGGTGQGHCAIRLAHVPRHV